MSPEDVKNQIAHAFADGEYPGDQRLAGSIEGDEPALLASEFRGKTDWRALDAAFLDEAPDGFSSALSFFSDEAFRFFLPAYLIASVDEQLESVEPVFHLIHGLTNASRDELVNPRRYGDQTWFDARAARFAAFNVAESQAVVAYLRLMRARGAANRREIDEALANFWAAKADEA